MNVNMANMPMAGGPVGGGPMPMMANSSLAAQQLSRPDGNNRANLNTYIYDYFLREGMFDCARAMLNSEQAINFHKGSPGQRRDENGNTIGNGVGDDPMDTDSKDDIDSKRPNDLPAPNMPIGSDSCFLYEWFCLFWDMLMAQRNKPGISAQVAQYVGHTQHQSRMKQNQQQELLRGMRQDMYSNPIIRGMPNGIPMNAKPPNLARTAMANNQNNPQAMQMLQAAKQNQMQRDVSNMDGTQNLPTSPGATENAPSPSKRPRLEGPGPLNAQPPNMMNGQRPQQGMPGQQVGNGPRNAAAAMAEHILATNGIDAANLTPQQFQHFQGQTPQNQARSMQAYSATLSQHHGQQMPNKQGPNPGGPQGQGSPMIAQGPDGAALTTFYNAEMGGPGAMRGGPGAGQGGGSNHALQDYQMQLMLLEQQNKKRLMMARQEQDSMTGMPRADGTGPGGPPGANGQPFPDTSPQGARPGASPNPAEQMKRGTPQMMPAGIPSPLPEGGQSRGSPNPMSFMQNGMDPNMQHQFFKNMNGGMDNNMVAAQMNGGMRPPSSHPTQQFNGQMNPQMMARQQGAPQGGPQQMQWQGPNGNGMGPQGAQGPQGPVQGTPQQRSMPPPSAPAPAGGNVNGRTQPSSPQQNNAAPPTPQQSNKAAPKKEKSKNAKSKAAANKKTAQPTGATPAAEPTQEPEPPTPVTPANQATFNKTGQNAGGAQPPANAPVSAPPPAPAAPVAAPPAQPEPQLNSFPMENAGGMDFQLDFANPLHTDDVLQGFDFDSFLHDSDGDGTNFDFNPANFGIDGGGIGAD